MSWHANDAANAAQAMADAAWAYREFGAKVQQVAHVLQSQVVGESEVLRLRARRLEQLATQDRERAYELLESVDMAAGTVSVGEVQRAAGITRRGGRRLTARRRGARIVPEVAEGWALMRRAQGHFDMAGVLIARARRLDLRAVTA